MPGSSGSGSDDLFHGLLATGRLRTVRWGNAARVSINPIGFQGPRARSAPFVGD